VLKTFKRGGVHPPENKLSAGKKIQTLSMPASVVIPVSQHTGIPARVLVNKGDKVKTGQLIAESAGFVSANIHSSVSGTVLKTDFFTDISGYRKTAVQIQVENDEWFESIDRSTDLKTEISLSAGEIISQVSRSGIVGLGGATFPSHVKLSIPKGKKAEYLIVNGVECEPYLTSDHALMLDKGPEIMVGIKILMKALQVDKAIIGIENNKPDAISHISRLAAAEKGISVQALKVKYPQGGEKQLISALLNREVPSGGLPVDVGVIAFNVGSVFAVYEAVQKNKPLIERVVTITGRSVRNPGNYLVRIGTPIQALIEASGGMPDDTGKLIAGGPMMGKAFTSPDVPVVKSLSGVLIIPDNDSKRKEVISCIRCARCISVCPMGLEPYLLMSLVEKQLYEKAELEKVMDCMECGSCSYTCPSNRPLLDHIRLGKTKVGLLIRARKN